MKTKITYIKSLLAAIVVLAAWMMPTKVWADETLVSDNSGYSANDTKITVTYNKTGSKAVLRFKDYDKYLDRYWSSLNLKIDGTEVLNLNDLWSDLTSSSENKHTTIVNNTTLAANEKSITLNGITIGTAKLQNRSYDTFYCYTELALNFNQYFSYYGHELTLTGTYKVTSSGFRRINLTGYMNGYPRPKSLTAIQNGTDVNLSWESEKYNDNTTTAGSWYIYRGTTQLGSVAYGTTSYTDTGWSCSAENKYTVVFVPTNWTAKADYLGINASTSITIPHTYGVPSWEWTGYESATCSRTCTNTSCISSTTGHTASADVTLGGGGITYAVTTPATCTETGSGKYTATATVAGSEYSDYKDKDIPSLGGHTTPEHFDDNGFKECTVCHAFDYAPLDPAANDWYEIKNAGQLYSFAELVNGGSQSVKARLTKDIVVNKGTFDANGKYTPLGETEGAIPRSWTPIGISSSIFKGQFDGNGYTISGLYCNTSSDYIGFVGYAYGATIQRLGIVNGYFKGDQLVGAICGINDNGSTIQQCWSDSKVVGNNYTGGICGLNMSGSTIEDCYSSGTVSAISIVGGICGCNYLVTTVNGVEKYSSVSNCYSTATVSGSSSGSICGWNRENCSVTNCYASTDKLIGKQEGNEPVNCETGVTAERFASGEICYKLNGSRSVGTDESPLVWYQTKTKDDAPKFKGMTIYYDAEKDPAYYNIIGDLNNDGNYTIVDLSLLIKALQEGKSANALPAADVDGDGKLDLNDIEVLREILLGIIGKDNVTLPGNGNEPTPDDDDVINADAKGSTFVGEE